MIFRGYDLSSAWLWLVWFPVMMFAFFVMPSFLIGRQFQQSERLSAHQIWRVDDSQIEIKTKFSDAKMDWGTFNRTIETKDFFLLYMSVGRNIYHVLPKRAFTPGQEAALRSLLQRHVIMGNAVPAGKP